MDAKKIQLFQKIFISGSMEDVWQEITKTHEPQKAVFNMQLHSELEPGKPMQMRTENGKYTGVVGKVLEFDPPHRFVHTMRFTQYDDPECTVTYELEQVEGGVEFTLRVDDLAEGTKTAKDMAGGASFICNNIKSLVEKGNVTFMVRMAYGMFKLMEPFSPAKTKSENWA